MTGQSEQAPEGAPVPRRQRQSYHEVRVAPEDIPSKSTPLAMVACTVGAAIGALVWGAIAYNANREIGWVAWGIGGLVGAACVAVGGRGRSMAVTAAIFSLGAILGGKILAVQWSVAGYASSDQMRTIYDEQAKDARDFVALGEQPTDAEIETFVLEHEFGDVSAAVFRSDIAPQLRSFASENPSFEAWGQSITAEVDVFEQIATNFHILDLLFAGLGIATAFGIVMKMSQQDAIEAQKAHRRSADANAAES